ncbi:protein TolR [Granulibacter bethesdensis]|nr:protein TolR [Granulibacter bethesdensis]
MAMSVGGGNGRGKGRYRPMAEINVTPLVDVMLVLLIVFMVTAPMLTSGVNVDLPKTNAAPVNQDNTPLTVSIKPDGSVYFQNDQVQLPELVAKLQAVAQDNKDRRIFVRGDKDVNYGTVMQVMGTITQGGFTKVALLAEQPGPAVAGSDTKTAPAASSAKPGKR